MTIRTSEEAAMATAKITKRVVDDLGQGTTVWDTEVKGFGVRRQTDGAFYVLRYRQKGKQRQISIGRHGSPFTVEMARRKALSLLGGIVEGGDPLAERHAPTPTTLGPMMETYLARREPKMKPRAYVEVVRHLRKHASSLHKLSIADVERGTIATLLNEVEVGSGPVARNQVRASLSAFWNWTIREGLAELNPVAGTGKAPTQSRDRVLSEDELRTIWHSLGDDQFGDIVRLLMLTGQRRDEIGSLRWSEIAGDKIILPPERTKNWRRHEVPLSPQAAAIIARQPRRPGRDLIFGYGAGGYSAYDKAKIVLDQRCGLPHFTLHDLRRTAATMMHDRLDVLPHIVEAILNHVSGHKAGVAGVYNRAKYLEPMRAALVRWASYVDGITGTCRVPVTETAAVPDWTRLSIVRDLADVPRSVVETKVCY
jgi:integrase